jgi:protein N-lysine methyltransferase METTL21A
MFLYCQVVDYAWGEDVSALSPQGRPPDVITGADIIYEERHYPALLATLQGLAAPHTLIYLASRLRGAPYK